MLYNLEAPVKTDINSVLCDNSSCKSNDSNQSLLEKKIAGSKAQINIDIDSLKSEVNYHIFCGGGGVVDLCNMPISYLHNYDCGFEYYPHRCNVDHNGFVAGKIPSNDYMQSIKKVNSNSVNRTAIPIYNDEHEHIYNAILFDNNVNMGETTMYHNYNSDNQDYQQAIMSFTNFEYCFQNQWACIVYINDRANSKLKGFYLYQSSQTGDHCGLTPYACPIEGALYITRDVTIHMVAISRQYGHVDYEDDGYNTPKTVYDNYCKDARAYEYYGHNYETYLTNIIDAIMENENPDVDYPMVTQYGGDDNGTYLTQSLTLGPSKDADLIGTCDDLNINHCSDNKVFADFNYPDKRMGYLNQAPTDFSFMGPDREPIQIDSIDKLLHTADIILSTGVPNYQMTRIPIKSGLNVEAWEHHLRDYADKRLLQYIKFGYPLSLNNPHELCNKEITNHYSACQYPKQVQEYLDKEKECGALLGPIDNITHSQYHYSPLLTRPKDTDKRRVILNLSHPYSHSVNDHVHKNAFDSSPFMLKFPSIDDITQSIKNATGDTQYYSK